MVLLSSQNKNTDFLMILAWLYRFSQLIVQYYSVF